MEKHLPDDRVTTQWSANACPNFITTKRREVKKLK
jgi:hypothetical protein